MSPLKFGKRLKSVVKNPEQAWDATQFSLGDRKISDGSSTSQQQGGQGGGQGGSQQQGGGQGGQGQKGGQGGPQGQQGASQSQRSGEGIARQGTGVTAGETAHGGQQLVGGAWPGQKQKPPKKQIEQAGQPIPTNIEEALQVFGDQLHYPQSKDAVLRKILIPTRPPTRAFVAYYEGIADTKRIEREVIFPVLQLTRAAKIRKARLQQHILNDLLPVATAERKHTVEEVLAGVITGEVALVLEGGCAVLADIKSPPTRSPTEPTAERTVLGGQMAFAESHRTNTAMVRSYIHDHELVLEQFTLGRRTLTPVSMMYIADIANPKLVAEVRHRLSSLDLDSILDSGSLERFLEDHPVSLVPTMAGTERPDRLAYEILTGRVGLIVGNSPRALICPVTYANFLHSIEEVFMRETFATFLRIIRVSALTVSLLLPAIFVAIVNYHEEMIPVKLLLILAASRSSVPLPLVVNLIAMELAFELIREAGLRIPSAIGPTIGIVGALLLGDMAVRSGLVTPTIVIVVAVTALSSFTLPDPELAFAVRVGRFGFIALAAVLGFYGVSLGIFALGAHLASIRSFGVPYLSPAGPRRPDSLNVIVRGPSWTQELRPIYLRPLDLIRQVQYVRAWDPGIAKARQEQQGQGQPGQGQQGQGQGKGTPKKGRGKA